MDKELLKDLQTVTRQDIEDMIPKSRQEKYLKYIALSGDSSMEINQTTGNSEDSVMSQKAITSELAKKVDKIDGKGLSTEDFTTEYKEKLDSTASKSYVDTELTKILHETILYSDETGTQEDITLSDSVENYKYLEVFYYKDETHILSSKIYDPDGKHIMLQNVGFYDGTLFLRSAMLKCSGTTLEWVKTDIGWGLFNKDGTYVPSAENVFFVTRVVGYK